MNIDSQLLPPRRGRVGEWLDCQKETSGEQGRQVGDVASELQSVKFKFWLFADAVRDQ